MHLCNSYHAPLSTKRPNVPILRNTKPRPARYVECRSSGSDTHPTAATSTQAAQSPKSATTTLDAPATRAVSAQYGWTFDSSSQPPKRKNILELRVDEIIRPLAGTRGNDQAKVAALMSSIQEIGLQEPIDVLLVEGRYYGFSGCHRYEAHQRLGLPTILCRVRKANRTVLKMHLM